MNNLMEQDHRFMCCTPLCDQTADEAGRRVQLVAYSMSNDTGL
jgi:hypothetical protein